MSENEQLKARVKELEGLLTKALPVVRLATHVKLAGLIADALNRREYAQKEVRLA